MSYWERNEYGGYGRISPADRGIVIPPSGFPMLWPHWYVEHARIRRDLRRSDARAAAVAAAVRTLHVETTYPTEGTP